MAIYLVGVPADPLFERLRKRHVYERSSVVAAAAAAAAACLRRHHLDGRGHRPCSPCASLVLSKVGWFGLLLIR